MMSSFTDINMIERIAKRLSLGLENDPVHEKPLLEDLKQVLESLASNQSIDLHQWNIHFASILFGLLEVIRSNSVKIFIFSSSFSYI